MIRTDPLEPQGNLVGRRARIRRLYLSLMIVWLVGLGVFYMITVGRAIPSAWPESLRSGVAARAQSLFARSAIEMTALVLAAGLIGRLALRSGWSRREPRRELPASLHWFFTLAFGTAAVLFLSAGLPAITDPSLSDRSQTDQVCLALVCGVGSVASGISAIRRGKV